MKKIIILLVLSLSLVACHRVPPGHVGLKVNLLGSKQGEIQSYTTGRYALGISTEWFDFPTFTQNYTWTSARGNDQAFNFPIKGGLIISIDLGVEFMLDADKIPAIFQQYRYGVEEIRDVVIRKEVRNALQEFAPQYDIDAFLDDGMSKLMEQVNEQVKAYFAPRGINIVRVAMVGAPRYPQQVQDAIIAKIEATQKAMQRENELREAEAEAKKKMAQAEGEAQSVLTKARAEAEANRLRQASYSDAVLRAMWIDKWDGKLPETMPGSSGVMLNMNAR